MNKDVNIYKPKKVNIIKLKKYLDKIKNTDKSNSMLHEIKRG